MRAGVSAACLFVALVAIADVSANRVVVESQPCHFDMDVVTASGNVDGALLFDFETDAEREAVRKWNPDYGSLISVTNAFAASGSSSLRAVGMGGTDDATTGYLPRLMLRPAVTDWREYDRLVVEVTSLRDSGANGCLRLFLAEPDGPYTRSIWLQLPLKNRGYRQWVVPLQEKWEKRLGNIARLFFSFEDFPDGCDVCIDRVVLLRKGSDVPPASASFIEGVAMPFVVAARDELFATNEVLATELAHLRDYVRFCGEASRSAYSSRHMAVGMATSMEKVRPRAEVAARAIPDKGLSLRLARNEYESVQVVVAALGEDLKGVKVAVEGFEGFSVTNIACEVMGYVNLTASSRCATGSNVKVEGVPGYKRRNKKAEKGWWPDPILSFTNAVDVSGSDIQSFWVRVHCPERQPAGLYCGTLLISAESVESVRVPLSIRVNGFSLGLVSELPLMIDCKPVPHGNWSVAKIPDSPFYVWKNHKDEWTDFLADYLISKDEIYTDGNVDFAALERLLSQGRLGKRFCIGYVGAPKSTNDADVAAWRKSSEKVFAKIGRAYAEAKRLGVLDRAYIYGWDEMNPPAFGNARLAAEEIHRLFPGVPLATTARDHSYGTKSRLDVVDWFIPNSWEYRQTRAEESRAVGHQVLWYICNGPRAPYANWFIECQAIETRLLMGAMSQRMKPDGFLYFRTAIWSSPHCIEGGPYTDWPVSFGGFNGDGLLTYVGPDGTPLPSLRLENFRDGLEDYAYAKILERSLKEVESGKCNVNSDGGAWISRARAALAVPREVMDSMTNYTDDPTALYLWRDEIADLIEVAEMLHAANEEQGGSAK